MSDYEIYFYKTSSGKDVIEEFIINLDKKTRARVRNGLNILNLYGLSLINTPWVKKIYSKPSLYELRVKTLVSVRLLFSFIKPGKFIVVHIFIKKSNKLPKSDLRLAIKRVREFI